jgi:hypothetical protein
VLLFIASSFPVHLQDDGDAGEETYMMAFLSAWI